MVHTTNQPNWKVRSATEHERPQDQLHESFVSQVPLPLFERQEAAVVLEYKDKLAKAKFLELS